MNNYNTRDPNLVGVDLTLNDDYDINYSKGDLSITTGAEVVQNSLLRRIYTPYGAYERYINSSLGLTSLNSDYENKAFYYLSAVNNELTFDILKEEISKIFIQDSRVELQDVIPNTSLSTISVIVNYRILSDAELTQQLVINL